MSAELITLVFSLYCASWLCVVIFRFFFSKLLGCFLKIVSLRKMLMKVKEFFPKVIGLGG